MEGIRHDCDIKDQHRDISLSPVTSSVCSSEESQIEFQSPISISQLPDHSVGAVPPLEHLESPPIMNFPSADEIICPISDTFEHNLKFDSSSKPKLILRDQADGVDSELFYEHLSKRTYIKYDDIKCHNCPIFLRSIGIEAGISRLMYCGRCNVYICTGCRPPGGTKSMTHSSTCDSPIHLIT